MIQDLIDQLLFMNFNGRTALMALAESGKKVVLEPRMGSDKAHVDIITGFAKRGESNHKALGASLKAKEAMVFGYMLGGHPKLALELIKRDKSLFVSQVKALALLGEATKVNAALNHPNENANYHNYLKAAVQGYAMGCHSELLLTLLQGTKFVEEAAISAACAGNTTLVNELLAKQTREIAVELLHAAALKGYAQGHHINQAFELIKHNAPITLWATAIDETPHCDNKINALLLLACFSSDERSKKYHEMQPLLDIAFTQDELTLCEKAHQALRTTSNVYQAFYQALTDDKSKTLNELSIASLLDFINEQFDSLKQDPQP